MPRLADRSDHDVAALLAQEGIRLNLGSACAHVRSDIPSVAPTFRRLYGAFAPEPERRFSDVTVRLRRVRGLRRFLAPQIEFEVDGEVLFEPFPADTHMPLLEWGMNFLFAQRLNHRLLLHAGVVEKAGRAVVLPAMPGSGKSTLTAALALSGFRLLSDEFGVVSLEDGSLYPLLRPIALKNQSIDVIAAFAPSAVIGPQFPKTRKGTVAHLAPAMDSVAKCEVPAAPALVIFPHYEPAADLSLEPMPKSRAFAKLSLNSFNYEILGPDGFDAVGALIERSACYRLAYSDLGSAIDHIDSLLGVNMPQEGT